MAESAIQSGQQRTELVCPGCGCRFAPKRRGQKYCSRPCILAHQNRSEAGRRRSSAHAKLLNVARTVHGESTELTPEYTAWRAMRRRCSPDNEDLKPYYFDRGIRVCAEWDSSYTAFLNDVGRKPGPEYSLDRIDNDRGYEPGNVRWATWSEQMLNRRPREEW